jgi:hypothetical protein
MSKLTRALAELAKRADAGDEASLMFLHNTTANKLERIQSMGGMPMPSIAITDKDIPFDSFGDITLVGKTGSFDPKANPLNEAYSADAYTVRAPSPVKVARKGAGKRFKEKFGAKMKELGVYSDDTTANIWDLESKGDVDTNRYNQVVNWFDRNAEALFLDEKGIKFDKGSGRDIRDKTEPFRASGEYKNWSDSQLSEIFDDQEYFITNPNRDYYTQRARLAPYTAEEITKFMKKSSGRGGEGGIFSSGPGSIRAEYTEKLTSLDAMRGRKDRLSGDIGIEKSEIESLIFDYGDALKPFYKYDANGFRYLDEVSDFLKIARKKGLKRAADEVGFENIPQDLMIELEGFQQILKDSPTEYFESKPKRVVQLNEFGGAIVPEGTSQSTIDLLTKQGLEIEQYADDAQRLEARKKFKKLLFQLPPVIATTIAGAVAAGSAPEAQAGPGSRALAELAKRADAGDEVARQGIRAYHGSPHDFPPVRELEMPDGAVVYQSMDDAVPEGARVIKEHPLGRLDMSKLGTGEGAQVYGRGLYFAEREKTAEGYRKAGTGSRVKIDGEDLLSPKSRELAIKDQEYNNAVGFLSVYGDADQAMRAAVDNDLPEVADRIKSLVDSGRITTTGKGSMYEVNIAATPDEFIDWDLPLDEQSESVMNALNKTDWYKYAEEGAINAAERRGDNAYGMDLVRWLEEDGAEDAAQMLKDAGIKGVQYADAQTRFGKGPKTKNYVVYDDKLIDITKKYGVSIPAAAAIAAGTMTPEEAQASTPQDQQASEYPSLGGMGVRMPPAAEDEEAMLAPTGGDLIQQANRDFADSIRTQPEPDFLTGVQQSLLSGIMKTAGVADLSADVVSAMAGPLLSAPGAIARYAADRYVPGVNYSAEEMAQGRRETEDYFNYQPRTEQGQQYGEQIMQGIGGAIAPYVPAIKKAAGDSYILGAMRQGYDYLGEREKELAKALMDLSPI